MKVIIAADIVMNRIYVNNIHNLTLDGQIVIEYCNVEIYRNNITLITDSILWYSPFLKMSDISKINVILLDNNNNEFYSTVPTTYVTFMRATNVELNSLCDFIKNDQKVVENMIEIGSYQGESTAIFRKNFIDSKIYAVDPWINNYDDRETSINAYNVLDIESNFDTITKRSNITKVKMFSCDFANIIADNSIDFIYVDGDHSYNGVKNDLLCWKNKIKIGGFIGGHDYNEMQADTVVKAISEVFPNSYVNLFNVSWLIKII